MTVYRAEVALCDTKPAHVLVDDCCEVDVCGASQQQSTDLAIRIAAALTLLDGLDIEAIKAAAKRFPITGDIVSRLNYAIELWNVQ